MGYVEMTMEITTFCQSVECDEDIITQGTLSLPANVMTYTCPTCGWEQEQSKWIDEGERKDLTLGQVDTLKVSVDGKEII